MDAIEKKSAIDILWDNICIKHAAIIRVQKTLGVFWVKSKYDDFNSRKRLAIALLTEMQSLLDQYTKVAGGSDPFQIQTIQYQGKALIQAKTMIVGESFLVVYDHNSDRFGLFDMTTIKMIVNLYTNARGFIYSIKTWDRMVGIENKHELIIQEMEGYRGGLKEQFDEIEKQYPLVENRLEIIANEQFIKWL